MCIYSSLHWASIVAAYLARCLVHNRYCTVFWVRVNVWTWMWWAGVGWGLCVEQIWGSEEKAEERWDGLELSWSHQVGELVFRWQRALWGGVEWKASEELERRGAEDWIEVTFAESETTFICCGGPEGKWPDLRQILLGKCKGRHRYFTERSRRKVNKKYYWRISDVSKIHVWNVLSPHLCVMKLYEVGKLFRIVFGLSCLWDIKFKIIDNIWSP